MSMASQSGTRFASDKNVARAASREGVATGIVSRFAAASDTFTLLVGHAALRQRITYADFADSLGLGSPRNLGWLLTPLLDWCRAGELPPLPIIVVRRADGLPSGGYDPELIARETERVFDCEWSALEPPGPMDLAAFALPRFPVSLRAGRLRPAGGRSPAGRLGRAERVIENLPHKVR